jgi:Tol biopolymer transport system component
MGVRWKVLFVVATIVVVYLSASDPLAVKKFSDWGPPVLVPYVNSEFLDNGPAISRDQRSLYFSSDRPGFGGHDIWVSRRAHGKDAWGKPVNLGPTINTIAEERVPALSRDGHWMFFHTDRQSLPGSFDLWVSYRRNTHDDFGWRTPVNLGATVNTAFQEAGASYFAIREHDDDDDHDSSDNGDEDDDGLAQLFFGSNRPPGGPPNFDLYVSAQHSDGSFGPPTLLSELNSPCTEQRPSIRSDGLEIFFFSNRPAAGGAVCANNTDLWVAKRDTLSQVWNVPENLGPVVNNASSEQQPYISSDGLTLYFSANRPGGPGLSDLYVTTRNKSKARGHDKDDD